MLNSCYYSESKHDALHFVKVMFCYWIFGPFYSVEKYLFQVVVTMKYFFFPPVTDNKLKHFAFC